MSNIGLINVARIRILLYTLVLFLRRRDSRSSHSLILSFSLSLFCVLVLEEHVDDSIATARMVEKYKQTPVDEPRALLQLLHCVAVRLHSPVALVAAAKHSSACVTHSYLALQELAQSIEILQGRIPVLHQNLGSELAPQRRVELLLTVVVHESPTYEGVATTRKTTRSAHPHSCQHTEWSTQR